MAAPAGWITTHRSFVNNWERDENDHWNVQFYFRAFQQASEIFAVQAGEQNPASASALCRHIRFHRELRAAQSLSVKSALVANGAFAGRIVHRLEDSQTGQLAATALDQAGYDTNALPAVEGSETSEATPRGVAPEPGEPVDPAPLLQDGTAFQSHYSVVTAAETGIDGELTANGICSRLTDSAPHVWHHAGLTGEWLEKNNCGRVAVEFKMTRFTGIPAGTPIVILSWIPLIEEKTMLLRHQLQNMTTGETLAGAEVRALIMDLTARKAVPIPDFVRRPSAA